MAPPLYFFPKIDNEALRGGNALNLPKLAEYGLDGVFSGIRDAVKDVSLWNHPGKGPDGESSGVLLTVLPKGRPPKRVIFAPDFQRWQKVRNTPELWIGIDKEQPPTPEDLARPRQTSGWPVELADGNTYTVPIVRSPETFTELPREMTYDADGTFQMAIQQEYQDLWEATGKVWDEVYAPSANNDDRGWPYEEILRFCLRFLAVNYRISRYEQMALHLVTTENCVGVMQAAVDFLRYAEAAEAESKKNVPVTADTTNTEPGETVEPPATVPAAAS